MNKRINIIVIGFITGLMLVACGKSEDITSTTDKIVLENEQIESAEETIKEDTVIPEDEWGISLTVKDLTCDGLVLEITQSGGNPTGELQFGEDFSLKKLIDNEWIEVETLATIDFVWKDVAYLIKKENVTEYEVVWKYLFGSLSEGSYKMTKKFIDFRGSGDYDARDYDVEFEIISSTPATYESEQDKENLNDTDKVVLSSSTVSIVSTLDPQSEPVYLSEEDASTIEDIIAGEWNNGAVAECINNCSLSINDSQIYYHSDCGTFNDSKNNRYLELDVKTKHLINSIFENYILLDDMEAPM